MARLLEKTLLLGLGVLTLTREKVKQTVDELIEEEKVAPEDARKLIDALVAKGEAEREELRQLIRQELDGVKPVTRKEFEELSDKIEELMDRLEQVTDQETVESEDE